MAPSPLLLALLLSILLSAALSLASPTPPDPSPAAAAPNPPTPASWPLQFHSLLFANYSGALSTIDLWYDWPKGRNFNIMQAQLGELLYILEWTNGTSFVYSLDSSRKCRTVDVGYGILRPNWLDGAEYLGQEKVDGFLCNVWKKVDFIWYYEDVVTKWPVHWVFYTGRSVHVMTFEVGATLDDEKWQAPVYCFDKKKKKMMKGEEEGTTRSKGFGYDMRSLRSMVRHSDQ